MPVYVAGGGGTHLEPRIASHYLAALVAESGARGVLGTVVAVKTQQAEIDAPLDDLVIDGRLADGTLTRLDLQITTTLSFTESDDKWQDIVPRAWATFKRTGFDPGTDRIGIAVSQTTTKLERSIQPLLARARHAGNGGQYRTRLAAPKGANKDQREFQRVLDLLIKKHDPAATDDDIIALLKCVTIMTFDLDQEDASRDRLTSLEMLSTISGGPTAARQVWSSLSAMASRVIPSGGGVDRATVVRVLQGEGHTIGSDRTNAAFIAALDQEFELALAGIRDTINGRRIARDALMGELLDAREGARLLRIVGEHGTGKSALLKRLALDEPDGAPIIVLRDVRVTGGGWPAHAARFGGSTPLVSLLRAFALLGSRTLFIDGADKMDAAIQITINDLLHVIATTSDLGDWRIVMTMREENAQRVDAWLDPVANAVLSSQTVRIEAFDDAEAVEVAAALPHLRPLLVDPRNYDLVLRRPFFLDALSRLPISADTDVRSEVDLLELWWVNGGADASDFAPAQGRRNVLLALGEHLLIHPGSPIPIRDFDAFSLEELLRTGVLRQVALGTSVAFSHDIYEEWTLERVLRLRQQDIAQAIRDGREDLQLVRPVQLLATVLLERATSGDEWTALLNAVSVDGLRATWSRMVLAAPVRSVRSGEMLDRVAPTLLAADGKLLARLISAVRTTETVRDLRFLDDKLIPDLSHDEREQFASEAAGPEIFTWLRLLNWLVPQLPALPAALDGGLYAVFDAWVGALPPDLGAYVHLPAIAAWARAKLGNRDTLETNDRNSLTGVSGKEAVRARGLLIKTAPSEKAIVCDYIAQLSERAIRRVRKQIADASASLAVTLPAETASFIRRAYFLDHDRSRDRRYGDAGLRDRAETLGFDDGHDFYPASPARPPFLQLLRADPEIGLELIRAVCNHAMDGWRRSWRRSGETPIPITIDLGAGPSDYWGDDGTYGWFRGGSHVHIVDTALLALDAWSHERLKVGDALDPLCRSIAQGNDCNAVLGICAGLCLADLPAATTSTAAMAIGTQPALWQWDIARQVGDEQSPHNEMGYWRGSQHLIAPLRALNQLSHRKATVRDLAALFAGIAPPAVQERYATVFATFLDRVPYATVEERDDPERAAALRERYEAFRQQGDPANLAIEQSGGRTYVSIVPPYAASDEHRAMMAKQAALDRVLRLYFWSIKLLEKGELGSKMSVHDAFGEMVALDTPGVLDEVMPIVDLERHHTQSALAATAAVLARYADPDLWETAKEKVIDVTGRAATMSEVEDRLSYRGSHVTGHPPAMAARGYGALIRRDPNNQEWRAALIQLAVDPIEKVVEAAHDAASDFADAAPDMVWRLFCLATQRAARTDETSSGLHWSAQEAREQSALADEAERMMIDGIVPTAHSAPSSAGVRNANGTYHWDFHANALRLPIAPMLAPATHAALIGHAHSVLAWALKSLAAKDGRGDTPFEWLHAFGEWLGKLSVLVPAADLRALLVAQVNAADAAAEAEIMNMVMSHFMIFHMLKKEPLDANTLEKWEMLVDWAIAQPSWTTSPSDARQHDRGMAVSALFCGITRGVVCGLDAEWPNMPAVLPVLQRAAAVVAIEQTAFAAILALLRARPDLLPHPGLGWIERNVRVRKTERSFWNHASNGERLVLVLRELVARGGLAPAERETIIEAADVLIELGVKGAAFLQQDLARPQQ